MSFKRAIWLGLLGLVIGGIPTIDQAAAADAPTPIKFVMDWAFEGSQSIWTLPYERGCFAKGGLNVTIDRGFGSGDSATKVASGAYDIGVVDFASIVAFNAKTPEKQLLAVFVLSDISPMSIQTLKTSGIDDPKKLVGKTIADANGEASRVMFPALARANGIDPNSVTWISVAPDLRTQMLSSKRSDAIAGHMFTILTGLRAQGVKDEDVNIMRFAQWGVQFYGSTVVTTKAWAEAHPAALTAFLGCAAEGIKGSIADPKAAVDSLKSRNSLLVEATERAGLDFSNDIAVVTDNTKEHGLSYVTPERMDNVLSQIALALQIPKPDAAALWTDKYLPPRKDLMLAP